MTNWDLVAKYLTGEATENEKNEVDRWLLKDSSNPIILQQMKNALRPGSLTDPDFKESMEADWVRLQEAISSRKPKPTVFMFSWYKIAASLLLLAIIGLGIWYRPALL